MDSSSSYPFLEVMPYLKKIYCDLQVSHFTKASFSGGTSFYREVQFEIPEVPWFSKIQCLSRSLIQTIYSTIGTRAQQQPSHLFNSSTEEYFLFYPYSHCFIFRIPIPFPSCLLFHVHQWSLCRLNFKSFFYFPFFFTNSRWMTSRAEPKKKRLRSTFHTYDIFVFIF